MSKHKSFIFTINNYTEQDVKWLTEDLIVSYGVVGFETGKENGTPHLQGGITFKRPYTFKKAHELHPRWHLQVAKAVDFPNYDMKEQNYIIFGDKKQGKRTDLDNITKALMDGATNQELWLQYPTTYMLYSKHIKNMREEFGLYKYRDFKPTVFWIYGDTGTGKTRSVTEHEDYKNLWISGKDLRWWQGYRGQEATLFDDFRADFCTFHELLRILDRYPYTVEVKHGHEQLLAKRMYITSPYHPERVYKTREDVCQLLRRIDGIYKLPDDAEKLARDMEPEPKLSEGNTYFT